MGPGRRWRRPGRLLSRGVAAITALGQGAAGTAPPEVETLLAADALVARGNLVLLVPFLLGTSPTVLSSRLPAPRQGRGPGTAWGGMRELPGQQRHPPASALPCSARCPSRLAGGMETRGSCSKAERVGGVICKPAHGASPASSAWRGAGRAVASAPCHGHWLLARAMPGPTSGSLEAAALPCVAAPRSGSWEFTLPHQRGPCAGRPMGLLSGPSPGISGHAGGA